MKYKIESVVRTVANLDDRSSFDGALNAEKMTIGDKVVIDAYRSNPFLRDDNQPAEMVGILDGRVIGSVGVMPMQMVADGKIYETTANPDTRVDANYRKTGYAFDLVEFGFNQSKDGIRVDFYVSPSARKLIAAFNGVIFDIAQFALVRHSRLFLESRLPKYVSAVFCPLADILFGIHRIWIKMLLHFHCAGWKMEIAESEQDISDFSRLIASDPARFRNNESVDFLKWILAQDFNDIKISDKHLWLFEHRGEKIGYVLMRCDAAGRGRLIDWQMFHGHENELPWMLLKAADKLIRTTKAVVISIASVEKDTVCFLGKHLPHLPMQAATVAARENSPLEKHAGWRDPVNWRIRPSMGDSCLY